MVWEGNVAPSQSLLGHHGVGVSSGDKGAWPMASAAVPACRPGPALASSPEAQRPAPTRLSKSGGRGRTHLEFLPGPEKLCTQPLPAGPEPAGHFVWLRLRWAPARLPTAVSPPRPLRGTESGRWRDRSRSEVLVQDSPALGTSPNPITGPGWHRGRPPTPDGPRPGTGWLQRTEPTRTAVCPAHPLGLPRLTPRSAHVL